MLRVIILIDEKFKERLNDFMYELNPLNDEIVKLENRIAVLKERKMKYLKMNIIKVILEVKKYF